LPNEDEAVLNLLPALPRLLRDERLRELLEPLLIRADRLEPFPEGRTAQLARLFDIEPLPAGALTRSMEDPPIREGFWLRADPAYVMVDIAAVRMMACGDLMVSDAERSAFASDLAALFEAEGIEFQAPSPARWYLRLDDQEALPRFHPAELALGADMEDCLPQGDQQSRWRRLLNEAQVALHQHPVNAERTARGVLPVNSLWFWGAGRLPANVPARFRRVASDEPTLVALAEIAGIDRCAAEAATPGDLVDLHDAGVEQIVPAIERAAAGATLVFADGARYRVSRWQRLRFWRRAPLATGEGT
jgi:hypothetical protein